MKAYKVFNPDWTCRGFKYKVGETYEMYEKPVLCECGFHACEKAVDCFEYYDFDKENNVAEVELLGQIVGIGEEKQATNKIKIVREIKWSELLEIVNTGHSNTGNRNTGNRNTGDRNTGNRNTGDSNTGHSNTGDFNLCNNETGFFNPASAPVDKVRVFGKNYVSRSDFVNSDGYRICRKLIPVFYRRDGKRHPMPYKHWWDCWAAGLTRSEKQAVQKMPGFDADVFLEITGLDWRK